MEHRPTHIPLLNPPLVGITVDVEARDERVRLACAAAYADAVAAAGGTPLLLPPIVEHAALHARLFDAFVLTGGDDPVMEAFGEPTHPAARPLHPRRQRYELALLAALDARREAPVLGVCLGMQLMALHAGGRLDQHMPDTTPTASGHWGADHTVAPAADAPGSLRLEGVVRSHHRQAVRDAGAMRVIARAPDGVIEAIDDPGRGCYFGVQWHPERTADTRVGAAIFSRLVGAIRAAE